MKKIIIILFAFSSILLKAQTPNFPDSINYQAVLRDASGVVLAPGTSGQLKFKVYSDFSPTTTVSYEENHSFTTNAVGLVNVKIGGGVKVGANTMANVNWAAGTACYEVYLNGNIIGSKQSFAAVPYALYAKSAGGAIQTGSLNQTLYWDGTKWKATSNFSNDGTRLSIGLPNTFQRRKFHVFSLDVNDSSVIFSRKVSANSGDAAYRGSSEGLVNFNGTASLSAIYGGDIKAVNIGTGYAVGVAGSGVTTNSNSGTAIGTSGVGSGPLGSTLIGVYASADTTNGNQNAYAAFFDQGKVLVGGSIYFPNTTALPGSVYKIDSQKKGYWAPSSATANLTLTPTGIVTVTSSPPSSFTIGAAAPVFTNGLIGSITPLAYPLYSLNIPSPALSVNGNSITITQGLATSTATFSAISGTGTIGYLPFYAGTSSLAISNVFKNGTNQIGVNTINPKTFFNVFKPLGSDTMLLESPNGSSMAYALKNVNNRFAMTLNGFNLKIEENGVDRMIFSGGNVGIGSPVPAQKLDVAGNIIIPSANDYLYSAPKTYYINLNPSALQYAGSATGVPQLNNAGTQITLDGTGASVIGYFVAPLNLPNGATITSVSAYIDDPLTGSYDYVTVDVDQITNSTGTPITLGTAGTTGPGTTTGFQQMSGGMSSTVNNNLNSYCVAVTMGNTLSMKLRNIKVTYNVTKAD